MNKNHIFKKSLGVFLIILGIFGLFLPFLQGIAFIALGGIMLGNSKIILAVQRFRNWINKKFS